MRLTLRRMMTFLGAAITLIGLVDLPQQLRVWADWATRLSVNQNFARWTFALLGIAIIAVANLPRVLTRGKGGEDSSVPDGRPTSTEERIFLAMSPAELTQHFRDGKTTIQAQDSVKRYIGKWLRISGELDDVGQSFVTLKKEFQEPFVWMSFGKRWHPRLEVMSPGTKITVIGRVEEIQWAGVTLEDCELID